MRTVEPPLAGEDWVALTAEPLAVDGVVAWAVRPHCGALAVFLGTVRDHAEGRAGVSSLEYEAYAEPAVARMGAIAASARARWSELGRMALLHRTGLLGVTETSVVVAVAAPHRAEALDAARWCIDTLKETVPIWKRETWDGGAGWAADGRELGDVPPGPAPATSQERQAG
jgi:molybdopterin synthase catalytic subunit